MGEEHIPKNAGREPAFQFYPNDWLGDPELRLCSAATRGVFIDLMCLMHKSKVYGKLLINGSSPSQGTLKTLLRIHHKTYHKAFKELLEYGVLKVDSEGVYYNARMIKDKALREMRRECGRLGGNPALKRDLVNQEVKVVDKPSSTSPSSSFSTTSSNNVSGEGSDSQKEPGGNGKIPRPMLDTPIPEIDAQPRWWGLQERLGFDDNEEMHMMYLIRHYPPEVINEWETLAIDFEGSITNKAAYFTAGVKYMKRSG